MVQMPAVFVPDPKLPAEEQFKLRKTIQQRRDNVYRNAVAARTARLQRVIDTLPITFSEAQKRLLDLRIQLIQYALLNVEFPITPEGAPETTAELERIHKQISLQPPVTAYGTGIASADLIVALTRRDKPGLWIPNLKSERWDASDPEAHTSLLEDAYEATGHALQRAVRLVRAHAREWRLDPARVGMMGFSAGGEVVAMVCGHWDKGKEGADDPVERERLRLRLLMRPDRPVRPLVRTRSTRRSWRPHRTPPGQVCCWGRSGTWRPSRSAACRSITVLTFCLWLPWQRRRR